ncbi:MAG: response regulator [Sulfurimonas sp.]|nr:response regulator [Sulfurimonas sp.]
MITMKGIHKYSRHLNILYVEDNDKVREETSDMFRLLFHNVDTAINGEEGLAAYNNAKYDIVITDINMPKLNGLEMMTQMREINPEQKIVAISAHDEPEILIDVMRKGISSFILKPINLDEMLTILYPVCRDADTQNTNLELFEALSHERNKYKKMVKLLLCHLRTLEVKNEQLGALYADKHHEEKNQYLEEYFSKDEDQGHERVVFLGEDSEEMSELLSEIIDEFSAYSLDKELEHIHHGQAAFSKIANILYRYTPFLDPLAQSLEELSSLIAHEQAFLTKMDSKPDQILSLFDAICMDLTLYVKRFTTESMAMKNIHHIHQPTTLSIQQIVHMIRPTESVDNDIEFF